MRAFFNRYLISLNLNRILNSIIAMRIFIFPIFALFLISCDRHYTSPSYSSTITGMAYYEEPEKNDFYAAEKKTGIFQSSSKLIVYNAHIRVVTKNVDSLHKDLKKLAEKYEGYVLTLGNNEAIIRVKAGNINQALIEIARISKLKSKTVRGQDVTEEFMNLQVRLDNANKSRQRYLELLQKASNVDEALKVEKELERLNLEIDLLEGKINKMSHLVQYSTINIAIEKKKILGPLGYLSVGIYKIIKVLFVIKS
jgi:hypothetical protein